MDSYSSAHKYYPSFIVIDNNPEFFSPDSVFKVVPIKPTQPECMQVDNRLAMNGQLFLATVGQQVFGQQSCCLTNVHQRLRFGNTVVAHYIIGCLNQQAAAIE